MSHDITTPKKPGRRSIVGAHPQLDAIEAACAAGISLRRVAERFEVPRMSLWRWWRGLPAEHRDALSAAVADQDNARWLEVSAGLAAIARRYPDTRADIANLTHRITDAQTAAIVKAATETSNYKDKLADLEQQQRQAANAAKFFGNALSDGFADAILEGKSFSNVLADILKQVERSAIQAAFTGQGPLAGLFGTAAPASAGNNAVGGLAGQALGLFGGASGGLGSINGVPVQGPSLPAGSIFDTIGSFFRASGGPVSAGMPYTIGERGRELFVPNQNGQVVPIAKGEAGGGPTNLSTGGNTYNITPAGGVTPEQLRATLTAYDAEQQRTVFARWQENKRRFG